jgi:transcriptional regulator with XRE-family HTH domain
MTPDKIREALQSLGLDQAEAVQMLGYKRQASISDLVTGKRNPSGAVVRLLQAYLAGYRPADWPSKPQIPTK